jgi:hypothetical protein
MSAETIAVTDMVQPPLKPLPSPSPFLSLPLELRIMIYQHLVTDLDIIHAPDLKSESLRHAGQRCCISLLRTNHQIYEEFLHQWCGLTPYEVSNLSSESFWFLKSMIRSQDSWPATTLAVRSFSILFDLRILTSGYYFWQFTEDMLEVLLSYKKLIDQIFAQSRRSRRELKLVLNIRITPSVFNTLRGDPNQLLQELRKNLSLLRQYTSVKLSIFRTAFSLSKMVDILYSGSQNFTRDTAEMLYTAGEFVEGLKVETMYDSDDRF